MVKVKEIRLNSNVKQEKMAEILDMSVANYSKKENGYLKWTITEAKKIADFFGKTMDEIFFANEVSKNDTK